jgi:uncharacterized protein YceK
MNFTKLEILSTILLSLILGINKVQCQTPLTSKTHCNTAWNMSVRGQEASEWCYAACTEMILNHYAIGGGITQCDIVKTIKGISSTSILPCISGCDTIRSKTNSSKRLYTSLPNSMNLKWIKALKKWGFKNTITVPQSNIRFDTIKKYLDKCEPIILVAYIGSYSYHAMIIAGYIEIAGCNDVLLLMKNPRNVCEGCEHFLILNRNEMNFNTDRNKMYALIPRSNVRLIIPQL